MIDIELIRQLPNKHEIYDAITVIVDSGVLDLQLTRLYASVAEGSESEKPEILTEKILSYRIRSHQLLALKDLGAQIELEKRNA